MSQVGTYCKKLIHYLKPSPKKMNELATSNKESQEEYHRKNLTKDANVPTVNEDYVTPVSEKKESD